ncbi:hypothetical protein [Ottowia thiooxydans]|uniref:Uncharacterized protein n=1 Tax=Ottowia thiooxydans TaxID=219182 RepID=A0ABV2QGC7_9BURK
MTGFSTITSHSGLSSPSEAILEAGQATDTSSTLEVGEGQAAVGSGVSTASLHTGRRDQQNIDSANEILQALRARGIDAQFPFLEGDDEFFEAQGFEVHEENSPPAPSVGATPGASKAVSLGSGEMSAQVMSDPQAQQPGWAARIYSGIADTVGRTLEYCDMVMANAGPGARKPGAPILSDVSEATASEAKKITADIANAGPGARKAGAPVLSDVSEATASEAKKITADIETKLAQLYRALIHTYQTPELALQHPGGSGLVLGNAPDDEERSVLRIRALAALQVMGRAVSSIAVAATLPAAAAEPTTGFVARIFAFLSGVVLGSRALSRIPENANLRAAANHITEVMNEVDALLDKLNALVRQERMRTASTSRALLVSLERDDHIKTLDRQIEQLQSALARASTLPAGSTVIQNRPVALGRGEARALMLERMADSKSVFGAIFSLVGRALTSLGIFMAGLPSFFFGDSARTESERSERAFSANYKDALIKLSSRAENSRLDAVEDPIRLMEMRGLSINEILIGQEEAGRQLCRGENLHSLIRAGSNLVLAELVVGDGAMTYLVPSNVTIVRDLASYIAVMADKPAGDLEAPLARTDSSGALLTADPDGKLFNFLMSMPTAYTANMVGQASGRHSGIMTIDHHGAGFPGGARSMQFERVFKRDEDGQLSLDGEGKPITEVRISFLIKQSNPVFTPLAKELEKVKDFMVIRAIAANRARRESTEATENVKVASVLADFHVEELQQVLRELNEEKAEVGVLMAADLEQVNALKRWRYPVV